MDSTSTVTCSTGGSTYTAYRTAGGAVCGKDVDNFNVSCEPGHSCYSASTTTCSR